MILLIETEIFSDGLIDEVLEMKHFPFTIKLHPNSNQILCKISIEKCVSDFKDFIPKVEVDNQQNLRIEFPKEDFLYDQRQILQHIESFGALDLGIKEINWDNPIIKWIPENDEERLSLPISEYRRNLRYEQAVKKVTLGWVQNTVLLRGQLSHLVLPLSFYRKGVNLYYRFEFSEAYLNFYLMLEGVFGNGKTKNDTIKKQFLKSEILKFATTEAINSLDKENYEQHKIWLETYLRNKKNNTINSENLISILVAKRGDLSHYSIISSKKQRNNFNEKENKSPAFIIMMVCLFATIKLRLTPFKKE